MDPITTAVLEALGKLAEPAVKDLYEGLKAYLARKFGKPSDVVKAVETLEAKPDSAGRRATLEEEIATTGAARDAELLELAQALLAATRAEPGGTHTVRQRVVGDRNIVAGSGNITINMDRGRDPSP
ncbi:MAG TPA: hypothetical protein VMI34_17240 [Candidatus Bathyarchaeia archaeon]|nr:hypothetical protein [Candidatus Bathyarchaeia archaeon]